MEGIYEVLGYTISNFGKEKNGDSFLIEQLENEGLLIAVVGDGVSQQPCDWLASSTTCQTLVDHFKKNISQKGDIENRLLESIQLTNKQIALTEGICHKMASTLSVVVYSQLSEKIYYANIGDSRIYSLYNGMLEQLTVDNTMVRREKVLTSAGMRLIDKPILTQVIGQNSISCKISVKPIQTHEIIILATDGFYEARKAVFTKLMTEFGETANFEEGFTKLIDQVKILRGDDLTAVAIKGVAAY
ncbi:MAG TPA: protein phosphatase 2C domain-containing protein [Hymenobacter sp.]|jgi:serine/threonine protein phosphatase PrpC|uniref:PP2C family protein-serine/threonine phosphatase n=1 Tax=Hymenobacter sp. TaxID=1898978 RepID=UPI002ED7CDEE